MSAEKLPEGWVECELSELGNIVTGKTPSTKEPSNFGGSIPFIKPGDLDLGGYIMNTADTLTEKGLSLVPTLPANSVVVTCIGNLGKVGITAKKSASNQQINALIPSEKLNVKFVYYQILTLKPWLESQSAATTIAIVNKSKFSQAPFKFPPLAEQKIIAEKLDTLLAQVDSTKARLEQIPQILKRFRQAVLGGAVNGKLTEKWRNFEPQHSVFKKLNFESILTELRNGLSSKPNESGVGHPILRISSVRAGHVDQNDIRFLECSESELNRHKLQGGDLLFTRYNGSLEFVGVCGLLKKLQHQNLLYPDKLIRARLTKDALPEYIEIFFSSPSARNAMMNCVKTTSGQKGISGKDIKSQVVLLPPVKEQAEIVRRVEQLFAYADTIEKQVNNALARVNNLTQSILAKAFRGELTAQWRAENPDLISGENSAAALLEKIKAERAASGGKKASRKKS